MTDPSRNAPYEDEDMRQGLEALEAMEGEKRSVRAEAAGKCSQIAKRQKAKKTELRDACGIPTRHLERLMRQRELERKLKENADGAGDDEIEFFEEASGQFSIFALADDEPREEPVAKRAARRAKKAADKRDAAEQEDGARVLEELGA